MKLLLIIMSVLLVLLLAGLWVGPGSYPERWRIEERSANQELSNTKRKEQIDKINAELDDASSGTAAIEERARSELGMTGKGETFYEVILQPEITPDNSDTKTLQLKNGDEQNKLDNKESTNKEND